MLGAMIEQERLPGSHARRSMLGHHIILDVRTRNKLGGPQGGGHVAQRDEDLGYRATAQSQAKRMVSSMPAAATDVHVCLGSDLN